MECSVAILIETETSVQNWQNPAPGVFGGMPPLQRTYTL